MSTIKPNSQSLNQSKISNKENFSDMNIERIREFIEILEEHQLKCEKEKKFVDAEIAKQKVIQLKQVEKEKMLHDIKEHHNTEMIDYESAKKQTFDEFNYQWSENFNQLLEKFKEFEFKLSEQHKIEINEKIDEIEKKFIPITKPTSEILNLEKILNGLIRHKEYIKAHQIQMQINKLSNIDPTSFLMEKERKIGKEMEKISIKHKQEFTVLYAKRDLAEAEFNKNKKIEFDKLNQGFKNKFKEIEIRHSNDLSQIVNPKKYLARNITSSKSRVNTKMNRSMSVDKISNNK